MSELFPGVRGKDERKWTVRKRKDARSTKHGGTGRKDARSRKHGGTGRTGRKDARSRKHGGTGRQRASVVREEEDTEQEEEFEDWLEERKRR